jgi:hypothetical protein
MIGRLEAPKGNAKHTEQVAKINNFDEQELNACEFGMSLVQQVVSPTATPASYESAPNPAGDLYVNTQLGDGDADMKQYEEELKEAQKLKLQGGGQISDAAMIQPSGTVSYGLGKSPPPGV